MRATITRPQSTTCRALERGGCACRVRVSRIRANRTTCSPQQLQAHLCANWLLRALWSSVHRQAHAGVMIKPGCVHLLPRSSRARSCSFVAQQQHSVVLRRRNGGKRGVWRVQAVVANARKRRQPRRDGSGSLQTPRLCATQPRPRRTCLASPDTSVPPPTGHWVQWSASGVSFGHVRHATPKCLHIIACTKFLAHNL